MMIKSTVEIGDETFKIEESDSAIKAIHGDEFTLEAKKPTENDHKTALSIFMALITAPNARELLSPVFLQQRDRIQAATQEALPIPASIIYLKRWEKILWSYYNKEGRFPVYQGIRREELLSNYINDVLTMIPLKQLRILLADVPVEEDMNQKSDLVIKLMNFVYNNNFILFKELQNTYFKSRGDKEEKYKNDKPIIQMEALRMAGETILKVFKETNERIAERRTELKICIPKKGAPTLAPLPTPAPPSPINVLTLTPKQSNSEVDHE